METGPRFIVPSDGLEKPGIEPATPGLQGEGHSHCTTEASNRRFTSAWWILCGNNSRAPKTRDVEGDLSQAR